MNTPILLILYNRPNKTKVLFENIKKIKPKNLFVAVDGPKSREGMEIFKKVVDEIKVDWECCLKTLFREKNLGCKKGVSSAITWLFEYTDRGIILEDDCIPDLSFYPYCEELLERYKDQKNIGAISGDNFQFGNNKTAFSYYFSKRCSSWGWATWKRVWDEFDVDIRDWSMNKNKQWMGDFADDLREYGVWNERLNMVYENKLDTWDYQWLYFLWKTRKLTVVPNVNLISNIGFGNDATHTKDIGAKLSKLKTESIKFPLNHPLVIERSSAADLYVWKNLY